LPANCWSTPNDASSTGSAATIQFEDRLAFDSEQCHT
jgi:hypothetical protein